MCHVVFVRPIVGGIPKSNWNKIGSVVLTRTLSLSHELPTGWEVSKKGFQCGDNGDIDGNR